MSGQSGISKMVVQRWRIDYGGNRREIDPPVDLGVEEYHVVDGTVSPGPPALLGSESQDRIRVLYSPDERNGLCIRARQISLTH